MGSRDGRGGGAVCAHLFVLPISIKFIVNSAIVASVMMGRVLGRYIIAHYGLNTPMLAGGGMSLRGCDILDLLVLTVHTHGTTLKIDISPD